MVRETGLEPVRPKTGDFKSPVATITPLSHIIGTSKKSESFRSTDQANIATLCFLLIAALSGSALTGTQGQIRTVTKLLLRERPLPIGLLGHNLVPP